MAFASENARRLRASIHVIGSLLEAEKPPDGSTANERLWKSALLEGARSARALAAASQQRVRDFQDKPPLCFRLVQQVYHDFGLKHLILIAILLFYISFGGFLFLVIEGPTQRRLKDTWTENIAKNRTLVVRSLMTELFNNSNFLVYIKGKTTRRIEYHLTASFRKYESQLDIRWSDQKMEWNYWNAILFAGTIITTIGYGHIYPLTPFGRILTMIYALCGIPLVLLVLQDLGKLLTVGMKYPWYQFKRCIRRILRIVTKQSMQEIAEVEFEERNSIHIFDIPLPAAISLIVVWIWLCSTVISYWGINWSFLEACYFFFISLSTIGLGDLVPNNPRLLLMMFGFILVGLSLVSMVLNLLQNKMRTTYEAGHAAGEGDPNSILDSTTLGILQCFDERKKMEEKLRKCCTRAAQTNLCLPVARELVLTEEGIQWIPQGSYSSNTLKSPDEVTALVEMRTDVSVLSALGETEDNDDRSVSLLDEEFGGESPTTYIPPLPLISGISNS